MKRRFTRRDLLSGMILAAGGLALAAARRAFGSLAGGAAAQNSQAAQAPSVTLTPQVYLPQVQRHWPWTSPVIHVHAPGAVTWDFTAGWYGDYVQQGVVDEMVRVGLCKLTETSSVADAWPVLIPNYQPGQKIAVKVNLNNASCSDTDNSIDADIETVNALIGSLIESGVNESDVWVYDAQRPMPARFYNRRTYKNARYFDNAGCADEQAPFNHIDPSLRVTFTNPALVLQRWLTDLLFQATYLINVPLLKKHGLHPVTLGFKNHFGSLSSLGGSGNDNPHFYINPGDSRYQATSSPLVDINANPHVAGKTVLILADGLLGAHTVSAAPMPWETFGGEPPQSLLLSRDPVAMDCVLCDLLRAEWGVEAAAYDYLKVAEKRGLGLFERGEPWGSGYSRISYLRVRI